MAAYLVQDATLTAIANQVRRLTGTNAPLSPAQMVTALSGSVNGEVCDFFRFRGLTDDLDNYGDNGKDGDGNDLTPYTVLPYLPKYSIAPPSTSITLDSNYHIPILDKFANLISGETVSNNRGALAEIDMPSCTAIPAGLFDNDYGNGCLNLASANFPACISIGQSAFFGCTHLEKVTLNSACFIPAYAFSGALAPYIKTLKLYLRGTTMGTCSDTALGDIDSGYGYGGDPDPDAPIPGLEIYVPAALLNNFKSTWAGGAFANNIFALTD